MRDAIPADVLAFLDDVAQYLRTRNGGKCIPASWNHYLWHALRKPISQRRGRRPHSERKDIMIRLLKAGLSEKRGALNRAIEEESNAHGIDTRTLERWLEWPQSTAGEHAVAPSQELIEAAAEIIAEELQAEIGSHSSFPVILWSPFEAAAEIDAEGDGAPDGARAAPSVQTHTCIGIDCTGRCLRGGRGRASGHPT